MCRYFPLVYNDLDIYICLWYIHVNGVYLHIPWSTPLPVNVKHRFKVTHGKLPFPELQSRPVELRGIIAVSALNEAFRLIIGRARSMTVWSDIYEPTAKSEKEISV